MKLLLFLMVLWMVSSNFETIHFQDPNQIIISVQVMGAIEKEGEYEIKNRSSLGELFGQLEFLDNAEIKNLNVKQILHDGDKITIPFYEEKEKISINFSTKEELMTVNGIGEKTAIRIIEYREEMGLFQQLEDLMQVKGIGQKNFEKIKGEIDL